MQWKMSQGEALLSFSWWANLAFPGSADNDDNYAPNLLVRLMQFTLHGLPLMQVRRSVALNVITCMVIRNNRFSRIVLSLLGMY